MVMGVRVVYMPYGGVHGWAACGGAFPSIDDPFDATIRYRVVSEPGGWDG
jgi:hypothetical protein